MKAQSLTEYTMVLGIVVLIFSAMTPLIRRGVQGMIRTVADQVGLQNEADQKTSASSSLLLGTNTVSQVKIDKTTIESGGITNYVYGDVIKSQTNSQVNLGFTERF